MKLNTIEEVKEFESLVEKAKGSVWIEIRNSTNSQPIMSLDMKSSLSRYVALGKIIEESKENYPDCSIELFCAYPEDESLFYKFFQEYSDTIN